MYTYTGQLINLLSELPIALTEHQGIH